ncbi:phosphotransferase family protein [Nocardioides sp.]|uniref:phosphotransferase family protein n=1 Tax=Nocardioides sp. TaxID=35761 RepID=UPI00351391D2
MDDGTLRPLPGGWSGETFLSDLGGEPVVVRIHARDPGRAVIDAAVLSLVRGLLPVPPVLEVRPGGTEAPGLLLTGLLPGERGDLVLDRLRERGDDDGLERLGRACGDVAGVLAGTTFPRPGRFVDAALTVVPWSAAELAHVDPAPVLGEALALEAEDRLAAWPWHSLVHADLNPKNLLVDPDTLQVTGVVDWEYAHVGHPASDLGNLLRLDRDPPWVAGVLAGFAARHPRWAAPALGAARAADLPALLDLAARGDSPPARRAADLVAAIAAGGLDAAPPGMRQGRPSPR